MTLRQATREIERVGWRVVATTSVPYQVSFDAKRNDNKKLARGELCGTADEAMASCLRAVLAKQ